MVVHIINTVKPESVWRRRAVGCRQSHHAVLDMPRPLTNQVPAENCGEAAVRANRHGLVLFRVSPRIWHPGTHNLLQDLDVTGALQSHLLPKLRFAEMWADCFSM